MQQGLKVKTGHWEAELGSVSVSLFQFYLYLNLPLYFYLFFRFVSIVF